jgi:hypothetical protein
MDRVGAVPPLNDVVERHGLFGQTVVSPHHLVKFPSMKALMTSKETTGLP